MNSDSIFLKQKIRSLSVEKERYEVLLEEIQDKDSVLKVESNDTGKSVSRFQDLVNVWIFRYSSIIKNEDHRSYHSIFALREPLYQENLQTFRTSGDELERFFEEIASYYDFSSIEGYKKSLEKKIKRITRHILYLHKLLLQLENIDKRKLFRSITKFNVKALEDADDSSYITLKPHTNDFNNIRRYNNDNKKYKCAN